MYYALVSFTDECGGNLGLLWGHVRKELALDLIDQCMYSFCEYADEIIDMADKFGWDKTEQEYGGFLTDFGNLMNDPHRAKIQGFRFEYNGSSIEVLTFSSAFSQIAAAFNRYTEKTCFLSEWRMRLGKPSPDYLSALDDELRANEPTERFFDPVIED